MSPGPNRASASKEAGSYHHGNLPDALRAATADLIAERGPSGFSLREVARRAGVSHAAPAHHFGDTEGLITSVATEGYRVLADALEAAGASTDDPVERLKACGYAYITTALTYPGHFTVMVNKEMVCDGDEGFLSESVRAYTALQDTVRAIRDELNPDLDVDAASTFCWSAVHGLAGLSPNLDQVADDTGTTKSTLDETMETFTHFMINGMGSPSSG